MRWFYFKAFYFRSCNNNCKLIKRIIFYKNKNKFILPEGLPPYLINLASLSPNVLETFLNFFFFKYKKTCFKKITDNRPGKTLKGPTYF